ncbi:MAG: Smr/MutS family protein [Terricaulis sp.]
MSKKKRDLTSDETRLWRRVAASVKPRRADSVEAEPLPSTRTQKPITRKLPPADAPPAPRYVLAPILTPPADRAAEKRVRRGKLDIGATLDLHGHTQVTARAALTRFLRAAQARGDKTVIIVTGIGRAGEGVLKRCLPEWLGRSDVRPLVSGYAQAHRAHGGAGAFYLFIKRAR